MTHPERQRIVDFMKLYARSQQDDDGWAIVGKMVWPSLKNIPAQYLDRVESDEGWGRCRLTTSGKIILEFMS